MSLETIIVGVLTLVLLSVLVFLSRDVLRTLSGSGLIVLGGLFTLFLGERVLGHGDWRLAISGAGLAILLGAAGLRVYAWQRSEEARRRAHLQALVWTGVVFGGLVLYGLTLEASVQAFGLDEEAALRWNGTWRALAAVALVLGAAPVLMLDRALALHPRTLPAGVVQRATVSGVAAALAVALVFPVNHLAQAYSLEWDYAYFRTARPGEATSSVVQAVSDPVEVLLFFPPGNDVVQEIQPYFDALTDASDGRVTWRLADQALEPELAEELKVRENGYIVLRQGDSEQKFKIGTDLDRAKRDLKTLDGNIQKHLLKLSRDAHTVYFLTGHGEASYRERDNPLRKLSQWKKRLEQQNYEVKNFGVADGSTSAVPDDAAAIVVAAPMQPLLPEEVDTLAAYFEHGGHVLVFLEPESDPLTDLLGRLGVESGRAPLAHAEVHARQTRGKGDRVLLATNKFGSHESVKTLSRNSQLVGLIVPTAVWVAKAEGTQHKVTTLVRSFPDTWEDVVPDREPGADETKKVFELAVAVEKGQGDEASRAIVIGDVNLLSDPLVLASRGAELFADDTMRWLVGDDELSGETNSEEDVKIVHTREEDQAWFWMTIAGVPFVVMGFGVVLIRIRGRSS